MTTINLYQSSDEEKQKKSQIGLKSGIVFGLAILLLTIGAAVGTRIIAANANEKANSLDIKIVQENDSLAGLADLKKILDLQLRLEKIKENLKIDDKKNVNQIKMSDVLDHLGADLSVDTVVTGYSYENGKISVTFTVDNYEKAARQIYNFKNSTYFKDASLKSIDRSEKGVICGMTMNVK